MYIPAHYKIEDLALTREFVREQNFGLLITQTAQGIPVSTHLPFYEVGVDHGDLVFISHLAKANPHCAAMAEHAKCLIVFSGPHGYVSPSHYSARQNVPTWNYMAVHVSGDAELIHSTNEKRKLMHETMMRAESSFISQYDSLSSEYLNAMYDAITFFRIKAQTVETKFKLSQNKPAQDILKVADDFAAKGKPELAKWMKRVNKL